jgi:serine/threonine protein kinase
MLDQASDRNRTQFFERARGPTGTEVWTIRQTNPAAEGQPKQGQPKQAQPKQAQPKPIIVPSTNPEVSLMEVIGAETNRKKRFPQSETGNSTRNYELFVDLIYRMLSYDPEKRIKPEAALNHPFITSGEPVAAVPPTASTPAALRR